MNERRSLYEEFILIGFRRLFAPVFKEYRQRWLLTGQSNITYVKDVLIKSFTETLDLSKKDIRCKVKPSDKDVFSISLKIKNTEIHFVADFRLEKLWKK